MADASPLLPLGLGDLEGLQHVIALYLRHLKAQCDLNSISTGSLKNKLTSTWLYSSFQHMIQLSQCSGFEAYHIQ